MTTRAFILIGIVTAMLLLSGVSMLLADPREQAMTPTLDCTQCHYCETPTVRDKCLKDCPRHIMTHITTEHQLAEAPDSILLGALADQYQPVRFDHKAHANMAEMGFDCATCHHYSPPGRIPPCRECHGGVANPNDLRQPALKGAYHRQCISCHREWSHDTKCVLCHLPASAAEVLAIDSTDIMGISHPMIITPDKKVYHTTYDDGPIVTFYHSQHVELYGLSCAGCHKDENCGNCHDLAASKETKPVRTVEQVHSICDNCHGSDGCEKCHDTKEHQPFSHASTGWPLNRFHTSLSCRACHPTGQKIARLGKQCSSCHSGWNNENFDHAVTGLTLDETHRDFDCEDCHENRAFDIKPGCTNCHDEDRDPRQMPPGKWLTKR